MSSFVTENGEIGEDKNQRGVDEEKGNEEDLRSSDDCKEKAVHSSSFPVLRIRLLP